MADNTPTPEQLRKARHTGFNHSTKHLPQAKRDALYARYKPMDERREKNVSTFVNQVRGAK
jgi:hypothetical protein